MAHKIQDNSTLENILSGLICANQIEQDVGSVFAFQDFSYLSKVLYSLLPYFLHSPSLFSKSSSSKVLSALQFTFLKRKVMSSSLLVSMTKRIAALLPHLQDSHLIISMLLFLKTLFHKYPFQLSSLVDSSELTN